MSCYFQAGDQDVWNPSNSVARVFIGQVAVLSEHIGKDSGLGPIIEDECEIDPEEFAGFVGALLEEYERSNNRPLRALLEGVLGIGLVLVERGGWPIPGADADSINTWRQRLDILWSGMPRG